MATIKLKTRNNTRTPAQQYIYETQVRGLPHADAMHAMRYMFTPAQLEALETAHADYAPAPTKLVIVEDVPGCTSCDFTNGFHSLRCEGQFTMADAMEVQANDLAAWKSVLNDETYVALVCYCDDKNRAGYRSSYDVVRGGTLDQFVANLRNDYRNARIGK